MNACKQGKVKTCRAKLLWIPKYVFSSPFCVFVAIVSDKDEFFISDESE